MTQRAVELLRLPPGPALLLDVGCGSGLSGEELTEQGHHWVGLDISRDMLGPPPTHPYTQAHTER
jgi:18S rRNA (guanine1575-N7)-methyltransferase